MSDRTVTLLGQEVSGDGVWRASSGPYDAEIREEGYYFQHRVSLGEITLATGVRCRLEHAADAVDVACQDVRAELDAIIREAMVEILEGDGR